MPETHEVQDKSENTTLVKKKSEAPKSFHDKIHRVFEELDIDGSFATGFM